MASKRGEKFWQALNDVPGQSSWAGDWQNRLQDNWAAARRYLRATGTYATEVACPSPGGDGCPRRIIRGSGTKVRAVCGLRPAECDALDFTLDDVAHLCLDRRAIARRLCELLDVEMDYHDTGPVCRLGLYGLVAGTSATVLFVLPGLPRLPVGISAATQGCAYGLVLVPTPSIISAVADLPQPGWRVVALSHITEFAVDGKLERSGSADAVFAPIMDHAIADLGLETPRRAWLLPAGARWEQLVFEFTATQVVNVKFGAEARSFDPSSLGMVRSRTTALMPTSQWTLLRAFAQMGGIIDRSDRLGVGDIKKQKQLLSRKLIDAFGIAEDPIVYRDGAYQTRFTIRGSTLDL